MSRQNNQSLQEMTEQFEAAIAWFEQDEFDVEQALDKFQQAQELAAKIKNRLDSIENKVTVLKQSFEPPV